MNEKQDIRSKQKETYIIKYKNNIGKDKSYTDYINKVSLYVTCYKKMLVYSIIQIPRKIK